MRRAGNTRGFDAPGLAGSPVVTGGVGSGRRTGGAAGGFGCAGIDESGRSATGSIACVLSTSAVEVFTGPDDEGKTYLTIGVGCTGGKHRSVALADAIASFVEGLGYDVSVTHRDMPKDGT